MLLGRTTFVAGLATTAVLIGGSAAIAAASLNHRTEGGKFVGSWEFYPRGVGHGGFHFWGTLDDTSNDGNAMKAEVNVEGYAPNKFYAPRDGDKYLNREVYDGAVVQTNFAQFKICRDRGTVRPDNCSPKTTHRR